MRSREGLTGVWGAERIEGGGGNREALSGPVTCGYVTGAWRPVTGDPGKWMAGRVAASMSPARVMGPL